MQGPNILTTSPAELLSFYPGVNRRAPVRRRIPALRLYVPSEQLRRNLVLPLLTPGWEEIFNAQSWATWYRANSSRFRSSQVRVFDSGTDPVEHLEQLAAEFQPATRFDLHQTHEIFGPLLMKVQAAADTL